MTQDGQLPGVNVSAVCRWLGMTPQNYYKRRRQRQQRVVDEALLKELVRAERQLQPRLGTRKLRVVLKDQLARAQVKVGRDRCFEVLRAAGLLLSPLPTAYPCTTNAYHYLPLFPNRIRDLTVSLPNEVWVADLTYLRTEEGYLYLSLLTDKSSRKIVGYHCEETLETSGCLNALAMAMADLPAGVYPYHHSDRGTQYCSHAYTNELVARGLPISMTEQDHCAENALAERMNGILKSEYGLGQKLKTRALARLMVDQAVDLYNRRRPHGSLAMRTPALVHSLAA